jgi:mRNA interferase MazF
MTLTKHWKGRVWSIFLKRGDVWEAVLEPRSGSEQRGVRPVIVVMRDTFLKNERWRSITVIPLSSSSVQRGRGPTSVVLEPLDNGLTLPSVALCHQITTLDRAKFRQKLGQLAPDELMRVEEGLLIGLGMERQ